MTQILSLTENGKQSIEHQIYVDFLPRIHNLEQKPVIRATIHVLLRKELAMNFWNGMIDRKLLPMFDVKMQPLQNGTRQWVTIAFLEDTDSDALIKSIHALLSFIFTIGADIIWKESCWGYQITVSGQIIRKWKLISPIKSAF